MNSAVEKANEYSDSSQAGNFNYHVWGGADIHVGLYDSLTMEIGLASAQTVQFLASNLKQSLSGGKVLDIGSGYGGAARRLAGEGYQVDCLNISGVQNERNEQLNKEAGLSGSIRVYEGNFQDMPFESGVYDEIESRRQELEELCTAEYINAMERGLLQWVEAAKRGHITWGIMIFRKAL